MEEKLNLILLLIYSSWAYAQSPPRGDVPPEVINSAEPASCSGPVAGGVVVTIIVIIVTTVALYFLYKYKLRSNTVKNKVDPECGISGGYDNPQFIGDDGCENDKAKKDGSWIKTANETNPSAVKTTATNTSGTLDRGKSAIEKVLSAVTGGVRIGSSPKTKDDSCLEPRQILVPLQGRDFAGLGFTINGNLKEGIFVKDVLLRGPTSETGKVVSGDKIMAVTVLMDHMVHEDAQSILSYASPYPVILHLEKGNSLSSPFFFKRKGSPSNTKLKATSSKCLGAHQGNIVHPKLSRSQSFDKLSNVKLQVTNMTTKQPSPSTKKSFTSPTNSQIVSVEQEKYVQREGAYRYSERAIDVPGEETRFKEIESNKNTSALTSVQVHRATQDFDDKEPSSEVFTGKSNDQDMKHEGNDKKSNCEDNKRKFGIKVLPEIISFKEKKVKVNDNKNLTINTLNQNQGNNFVSGLSSISILSSKKDEQKMETKSAHSSTSEENQAVKNDLDQNKDIDVTPIFDTHVQIEDKNVNTKIDSLSTNPIKSNYPQNLTFFSVSNVKQCSSSDINNSPIAENLDCNEQNEDDNLLDTNLNSNNIKIECHPIENSAATINPPWSNKEIPSGGSTPDIDQELDESTISEVNATDTSKKRKYRYMLANSSIVLPESPQPEEAKLSAIYDQELSGNQSDEAKRLSLKGKSSNISVETGGCGDLEDCSFYSENSTHMALDLDDIELERDGNVCDEKKIEVIGTNTTQTDTDNNIDQNEIIFDNVEHVNSNLKQENVNDCHTTPRKISFTEFALSDAIPLDMTSLTLNSNKDYQSENTRGISENNIDLFGSVFGFQGFRNRIGSVGENDHGEALNEEVIIDNIASGKLNNSKDEEYILDLLDNTDIPIKLGANISHNEIMKANNDRINNIDEKLSPSIYLNKEGNIEKDSTHNVDNQKSKSKFNFGFRGLSRSSSDTDEEKGKVSSNPKGKTDKSNKSSLPFKFRSSSRSSESEDCTDYNIKVKTDPNGTDIHSRVGIQKPVDPKVKPNKEMTDISSEPKRSEEFHKIQKPPRTGIRKFSDSEEDLNEDNKISCDPKGAQEKTKDSKSKSLKLGFNKGFKNLKGKIQTEINRIRHESHHSDDEIETKEQYKSLAENNDHIVQNQNLDTLMMEHAANAAKENRRKVSRSSSFSACSSEESENITGQRKKKKTKKKIDKNRIVTTGVLKVELSSTNTTEEVNEIISPENRSFEVDMPNLNGIQDDSTTFSKSIINSLDMKKHKQNNKSNHENNEENSPRYVVKTEMTLTPSKSYPNDCSIEEVFDKVTIERKIPRPMLLEERAGINVGTDTDGGSYGSDSDMDHIMKRESVSHSKTSVNLAVPSKKSLTDSEELKRKTASLGDLSRIHEGLNSASILERAVSLDLNTTTDNHGALHVKRLKLPDSSATSIDEVDEKVPYSPIKLEQSILGLKAASQWGTLEEALQLSNNNSALKYPSEQYHVQMNGLSEYIQPNDTVSDKSVSNIEISGDCGPSITSLSSNEDIWNAVSYDNHPLSRIIPNSKGKTTITLQNNGSHSQDSHYKSDSNIVIIPGSSDDQNELSNIKVHVPPLSGSTPDVLLISNNFHSDESYSRQNSDLSDKYSQNSNELDSNKITLTMISTEDLNSQPQLNFYPPPIPPKPKSSQSSISPDLHSFDSGISAPVVTVNNDWSQCDPDVNIESSKHNSSDDFITPGGSPQKSTTQISLKDVGYSGYLVQDGDLSKTVIISNPDLIS